MNSLPERALRMGILGTANIARQFIDGVRSSSKIAVTAVASRDADKARAFARATGVALAHPTYEAMLADPAIDAIYNPLPNTLHAQWSIRALEAGKHVLCEKPLATSPADARSMFDAAKRVGLMLVEGYPYRAQPQTRKLRELLAANAIGRVRFVQASIGFPMSDPSNIRMNPALAGGALMDAGCYPVSLVRMIAGTRPARVHAMADRAESGVDRTLVASLEFADGLLAQISTSFATARHRHAFVAGDAGSIGTTYLNDTSAAFPGTLELKRGTGWDARRETVENAATSGFLAEAEAFSDLVTHGWDRWTGVTPDESIDIALILEAIATSAREGAAIDVAHQRFG
jgi:D-xylose 1-dehydrogenase (NADP+, D-xylono-1,5-lactone-forming)